MEVIRTLISEKFSMFNVGENKRPVNSLGYGLNSWESLSYTDLCNEHNFNIFRWGLKMGQHENGRRITQHCRHAGQR